MTDIRARYDYPSGRPSHLIASNRRDAHMAVAVHEAGHALTADVLGVAISYVTIIPTKDEFDGYCLLVSDPRHGPADIDVTLTAAGAVAAEIHGIGKRDDSHWSADWQYIADRLAEIPESRRRAFWESCVSRAESILLPRLQLLRGLAKLLFDRKTLSGQTVAAFIEAATRRHDSDHATTTTADRRITRPRRRPRTRLFAIAQIHV